MIIESLPLRKLSPQPQAHFPPLSPPQFAHHFSPCLNKLTIDAALEGDKYASGAVGFHPALSIKCASADDCVDTIIRFQGYCGDYVVPSAKGPTPSYPALWPTTGECAGSSPHNNCLLSSDCSQLRCTAIVEGTPIAINMGVCDDSVLFTITETSETHSETGSGDAAGFSLSALGSGSSRSYVVSTLPNIYKGMLTDRTFRVRLVDSGPQDGTSDYRVLVNLDSCEGTSDSDPCEKLLELVDVTMHRRSPPYCSVPAAIYPAKPPAPPALCAHVPHLPANCHVEADCTVITCNVLVESVPLTISLQPCSGNKVYAKTAGWEQTLLEGSAAVLRTDLSIPTDGLLRNRVLVLRVTNSHWKSGGMFLEVNLDRCFQYSLDECEKLIGLISVTLPSAYGPQACSSSASSSNSGGSVFVIAGAVAGTLVLIATVVAVVIWRRRHHDEATYEDMAELQGDFVAQNEG